jgi:hypothetical protein
MRKARQLPGSRKLGDTTVSSCLDVPSFRQRPRDAGLAVTRGEMDAPYVPESSAISFVKAKQNWALATISRTKSRFFPDRPTIFEAAKMDADGT